MIAAFSLLLTALVVWRGICVQKCSVKWKIILSAIVVLSAFKFQLMRLCGGEMFFAPDIPAWILIFMTWAFAVVLFFALWLIAFDLVSLFWRLCCRFGHKKVPGFFTDAAGRGIALVPIALLAGIVLHEGLKTPAVREYAITVEHLPAELDGMKIVHLSDIHVDPVSGAERVREIVRLSNACGADLILLTGDFVDGRAPVRGKDLLPLGELRAPLGVYGVPGNHEYYSGYSDWMTFLREQCSVSMLENRHVILPGTTVALGGVTDPAAERMGGALPDVPGAFAGAPEGACRILMAHQPKLAESAAAAGVDLMLSGHTHGGMIWGLDVLVGALNHGYYSGIYRVDGMKLFVSNGAGLWSGFPIRLGRPGEIALITLRR